MSEEFGQILYRLPGLFTMMGSCVKRNIQWFNLMGGLSQQIPFGFTESQWNVLLRVAPWPKCLDFSPKT
jgi:hypothetical protein